MVRTVFAALTAAAFMLLAVGAAAGHPGQHGPLTGHLIGTGAWGNLQFVSKLRVHDAEPDVIADLTIFKNYAYLSRWGGSDCAGPETGGQNSPDGGAYVIDISNLASPREVGFIATSQDTLVGEGMQALTLSTSSFSGDVLVMNHEQCGKNGKGGFSLWSISNPLKPVKLSEHAGDVTTAGVHNTPHDTNQYHSAFAWQAGDRAYLVATDDDEAVDVDIFDITNPKKPTLASETDLNKYDVSQPELALTDSFLHDMVVKRFGNRFIMLASYWDGGYVLLDVSNPASPVFLSDTDYPAIDPEVPPNSPEGNGHQGEFTLDSRFAITTDEDFGPFRLNVITGDGSFRGAPGTQTSIAQAVAVDGTTTWVGRACPGDPAVPAAATGPGNQIAVVERGLCFFEEKAQSVLAAGGYEAMIIVNREGADACTGVFSPSLEAAIPTIFVGRDTGFRMFNIPYDQAACADATAQQAPIAIGTAGDPVLDVTSQFDGWGYVHLYGVDVGASSGTLTSLDTFAIPEATNPAYAEGFGALSVHEVATDKTDASRAYLSYYSGGIRSMQIQCSNPNDRQTCRLVEVGGYLDPLGNNFWGIETFTRGGATYVAGSDMDYGMWILKRTP